MGLFSSFFGAHPNTTKSFGAHRNTTKMKVAGLTASAVDYVINDEGEAMLVGGSIVLDRELRPTFHRGKPERSGKILAIVAIRDLEEAEILKFTARLDMHDPSMCQPFLGQLIDAVLREFEAQCPDFAALPTGESF